MKAIRVFPGLIGIVAVRVLVALMCLASASGATDPLVPGSVKIDPVRQAAWRAANSQAKNRIDRFDAAVKGGDPDTIRQATLDLQADPIAVQQLNNSGRTDLVQRHNAETDTIKDATKRNIKQEMADRWNAENPHDLITPDDVEVFEPTNYKRPDAEPRVGQDWDVTVKVRGKDVPTSKSQGVVESSYFKAAGGEKTFGKGTTPREAAHRQSVEVTDRKSLESYKEPDKILGRDGQAPDHAERLQNPEDMGDVIEYKSNQAANKAEAARTKGNQVEAVRQDFEQMRQAVKQYDKITDPRVKAQGGKVGSQVEKGMQVMRDVASMKISPEEGRALLAAMGETPDSIARKAASQIEAAQKLKPPDAPKATAPDAPKATAPDAPKATAPDAPKATPPDAPKMTAPDAPKVAAPDAPKVAAPDAPKVAAPDAPKTTAPDAPKVAAPDAPKATAHDAPKVAAPEAPKVTAPDAPKATAPDAPQTTAPDAPKVAAPDAPKPTAPDAPKVAVPDAPKVAAPDAPKVAVPDAPKVAVPDAPKVAAPDVPSVKAGKAGKAIGKVGQGVGAVGDALDIFGNAQDFTKAAEEGDVEGMKDAVVNMGDAATGGGYGTAKLVKGRAQDGGEYAAEVEGLDRGTMENLYRSQVEVELRRAGYSKEEADKMVSDMEAGNDVAVKSAYGKMGKEMPERETAGVSSFGEAAGIYGAEVKENIGDVATGIKTSAVKAGEFLQGTAENLGEMAVGVATESGVASELAEQVGENLGPSNIKEGYDAWKQSQQADEQTAEGRQRLEDKFVAEGARRSEAKKAADDFYGIGMEDGRSDSSTARALTQKLRDKKALRGAEPMAEDYEEDDAEGGDAGSLGAFSESREGRIDENADSSRGLMAEQNDMEQVAAAGGLARADARRGVDSAGEEAQMAKDRTAGSTAAANRADSLGKAIADGVQGGLQTGAAAMGSSFGHAAGKEAADSVFGDPDKKRHDGAKGGSVGGASGPAVADGKKASPGKGAQKGGKPKEKVARTPVKDKQPQPKQAGEVIVCPKCNGTQFGPPEVVHSTPTSVVRDRRCLKCGHMGGRIYPASGGAAPAGPAPAAAPAAAAPQVPTKRAAIHVGCGSEMVYKGVYYADGTDMYSCPKCGGTYHNVSGKPRAIEFRNVPVSAPAAPAAQ